MNPFIFRDFTRLERSQINRWRRNWKRKLVRYWHGSLRRNDERKARIAEKKWIMECVPRCNCEPPHDCPCESVLCGGLCDERGLDFDAEDEVEDEVEDETTITQTTINIGPSPRVIHCDEHSRSRTALKAWKEANK